jgi:hypothetical protein
MAAFNRFNQTTTDIAAGAHAGCLNANTSVIKAMLTNSAPVATNAVKGDLTEISATGSYAAASTSNSASASSGVITVVGTDITWTASGGSIGPFRYAVIYNDTQTSPAKPLLGWWDYGSSITLAAGESFTLDFGASMFTIG